MSRMIAYVGREPIDVPAALGDDTLASFAALSRLHADGWGAAWRTRAGVSARVVAGRPARRGDLAAAVPAPSTAALLYLRFGSAGSGAGEAEAQPFLRGDRAFQHNGALSPPDLLRAKLTDGERGGLRGGNDSELYFAFLRRALAPGATVDPTRIADAVATVRALYPEACLNALLLTPTALVAVHSSASRPAPRAAFAARGFAEADLPPGHGDGYNVLFTRRAESGARLVATTGIPLAGWMPLPTDTVSLLTPDSLASVPLPRVASA
ncbi:MAG: class II glutamine amidotransferase [Microbacterium sp.]|uniref:class II glutamine amidotransferase n=1 Tax=unclassified Microbacterium TaxID=2609290 RepID=UPI000AFEF000|nr:MULTISPECIES: class II glutamine amidotransferase [unclassified Microbacterium]MBN9210389.1 class II glutamine amidotransferase [Microbacterium sp.]